MNTRYHCILALLVLAAHQLIMCYDGCCGLKPHAQGQVAHCKPVSGIHISVPYWLLKFAGREERTSVHNFLSTYIIINGKSTSRFSHLSSGYSYFETLVVLHTNLDVLVVTKRNVQSHCFSHCLGKIKNT